MNHSYPHPPPTVGSQPNISLSSHQRWGPGGSPGERRPLPPAAEKSCSQLPRPQSTAQQGNQAHCGGGRGAAQNKPHPLIHAQPHPPHCSPPPPSLPSPSLSNSGSSLGQVLVLCVGTAWQRDPSLRTKRPPRWCHDPNSQNLAQDGGSRYALRDLTCLSRVRLLGLRLSENWARVSPISEESPSPHCVVGLPPGCSPPPLAGKERTGPSLPAPQCASPRLRKGQRLHPAWGEACGGPCPGGVGSAWLGRAVGAQPGSSLFFQVIPQTNSEKFVAELRLPALGCPPPPPGFWGPVCRPWGGCGRHRAQRPESRTCCSGVPLRRAAACLFTGNCERLGPLRCLLAKAAGEGSAVAW